MLKISGRIQYLQHSADISTSPVNRAGDSTTIRVWNSETLLIEVSRETYASKWRVSGSDQYPAWTSHTSYTSDDPFMVIYRMFQITAHVFVSHQEPEDIRFLTVCALCGCGVRDALHTQDW